MSEVTRSSRGAAERLRRLRSVLHLSQRELAEELRVAASAVAHWETGRNTIPGPVLRLVELFERELGLLEERSQPWRLAEHGTRPRKVLSAIAGVLWILVRTPELAANPLTLRARQLLVGHYAKIIGSMKGLPMKIGQMTGYMGFVLPEEEQRMLMSLHESCPPIPSSELTERFVTDLGAFPRQVFARWEREPFAMASFGQVHRATLESGQAVAVKVQYPGIREALRSDLPLELLHPLFRKAMPSQDPKAITDEWMARFSEEADYKHEADALERFAAIFAARQDMCIPRVFRDKSSPNILTMEYLEGRSFDDFAAHASAEERNRAAATIFDFFFEAFLREGCFHADPNPANFVFMSGGRVGFLDFGRSVTISPWFRDNFRRAIRGLLERNWFQLLEAWNEQAGRRIDDRIDRPYAYREMLAHHLPFVREGTFQFTPEHFSLSVRLWGKGNPNTKHSSYPRDMVFMHQLYFGVFAILTRLGANVALRAKMLDLLYAPGEVRPEPFSQAELAVMDFG